MGMCRFFTEERHPMRWPEGRPLVMVKCRADGHIPGCAGYSKDCTKEPSVCRQGTWQGIEVYCKHSKGMEECKCDMDFCELTDKEQLKVDWYGKEAVCQ